MTVDIATFRANFPEFSNTTPYPDPQVQFYLDYSVIALSEIRWNTLLDQGTQLFVAHNLALAAQRAKAAATGAIPGVTQGAVNAKAVDKVSVGYDSTVVTLKDGGHWNLTTYGIQFLQLARMVGAAGIRQL